LHKNTFSTEKTAFFATRIRKDVESYSQVPGKRIALEFSNFSGEARRLGVC
jgi:hypothetical protein